MSEKTSIVGEVVSVEKTGAANVTIARTSITADSPIKVELKNGVVYIESRASSTFTINGMSLGKVGSFFVGENHGVMFQGVGHVFKNGCLITSGAGSGPTRVVAMDGGGDPDHQLQDVEVLPCPSKRSGFNQGRNHGT